MKLNFFHNKIEIEFFFKIKLKFEICFHNKIEIEVEFVFILNEIEIEFVVILNEIEIEFVFILNEIEICFHNESEMCAIVYLDPLQINE